MIRDPELSPRFYQVLNELLHAGVSCAAGRFPRASSVAITGTRARTESLSRRVSHTTCRTEHETGVRMAPEQSRER